MAFELDLDELKDNLDSFNITCPENHHVIEKLEGLCKTFRKTTDDISDEIVSVMNNTNKKTVDSQIIGLLEESLESQSKKMVHTPRSVKKPAYVETGKKCEKWSEILENTVENAPGYEIKY
uniref:DNA polymerase alpha subunit B N-terminal domain-containing protein n=1 Tax=Caenorhabditis japonica TaxID=281687 RepID=A0A8R1EGK1_CAEJA